MQTVEHGTGGLYRRYENAPLRLYELLASNKGAQIEAAERFTLGLKLTNNGWEFDQAYCKYDKQINEDSKVLIEQFLAAPVVKNKLMGLADKGQVPYEETASVNPTDEDDEWLRTVLGAA